MTNFINIFSCWKMWFCFLSFLCRYILNEFNSFGKSGVEFYHEGDGEVPIVELFFLPNEVSFRNARISALRLPVWVVCIKCISFFQGRIISLCGDNALHLYEVNVKDGKSVLEEVKSCSLEGRSDLLNIKLFYCLLFALHYHFEVIIPMEGNSPLPNLFRNYSILNQ